MIELPARRGKDDAASLLESADAAASDEPRAPSPWARVASRLAAPLLPVIFVLPVCRNSSFHVHHWYWTWLIGMHANRDCWWSTAAGAFLWGGYLNGVAAWGRDDVLGCERSLYAAVDQGCPFVSTRRVAAADVSAPDWRTCSPAPR